MTHGIPPEFKRAMADWPAPAQDAFFALRGIILNTANGIRDLTVVETLKWGQPSWLPDRPRVGSTLRAHWVPARPDHISLYVHCQTTLAETMRTLYPDSFEFEGNRALHMPLGGHLPEQALAHCAEMTLTYHRKTA